MSQRNILWIALFIIIFCWKFKVFHIKVKSRNYSPSGNMKPLVQEIDFLNETLHDNRDKEDNSSIDSVFITEMSESVGISSSELPCKLETSNGSKFDSNNPCWDYNPDTFKIILSRPESEMSNASIINSTSLNELSRSSEETTENYNHFDQHFFNINDTANLHSNYTRTERMSNSVDELNMLTIFSKEEALIPRTPNYNIRTVGDILELDLTTGRIDAFKAADSLKIVNDFQDKFSDGNTLTKSDLVKSSSIQKQFVSNYNSKKNDGVQILNYIHEMYDAVQGTFAKLEEINQLVNDLKSRIDDMQVKIQPQPSVEGTTQSLFDETKCTLQNNLEQHKVNLEFLEALKLNINQGFFKVDKLMSDLADRLTYYEELHQSNSHDTRLLKSAKTNIFDTMRTINSLTSKVQKESYRFLRYIPDFKIVCR